MPAVAALASGPAIARSRAWPTTALDCAALFGLALLVRLLGLDRVSLWHDEFFSVFWSHLDPAFILGHGALVETNPPAYYLLLHYWMAAFGDTPAALRLLSGLASAGSVLTVYGAMRLLAGRQAALLAAGLVAVNVTSVYFSQQIRAYPFVALSDGLMVLALAGYCRRLESGRPRLGFVALFAAAAIASFLFHYTSLLTIAAGFGAIGLYLLMRRPLPWREALVWLAAGLVVGAAILKPFMIAHALQSSSNLDWIDKFEPWQVRGLFVQTLTVPDAGPGLPWAVFAYALALVMLAALIRMRSDRAQLCVLVAMPVLFCALVIGASLSRPILLLRVTQWLELPVCMLLATGILAWRSRLARLAVGGFVAACLLVCLGRYELQYAREDWRAAAGIVASDARCGGPIVTTGPYGLGILYYQPQTASRPFYDLDVIPGERQTSEYLLDGMVQHPTDLDGTALRTLIATHSNVALIAPLFVSGALQRAAPDLVAATKFDVMLPGALELRCF